MFEKDEKKLMIAVKAGDERAFHACVSLYYNYVVYIVQNIIGMTLVPEDKEEVIANVFISLWKHRESINAEDYDSLKPYIGAISRNMAKNALRKMKAENQEYIEEMICISTNENIEKDTIKQSILECLRESIEELSAKEKKCFIASYYYGKTIQEIARETGIKISTIKSILMRGRKKLKNLMERKGIDYADYQIFFE